ncbi:MAG: histidine--tRNA ligase [Acidobacteria bacterium]|nr:MAG: histidine--tRNA ligase [Acidobacteriota bacterium]RLE21944.1 MAG: histidine--tRNA ligase [Acidobacteriota bacterium]
MAIKAVKGTRDILAPEIRNWTEYEERARKLFRRYGFEEIRTPIFEYTEVFSRGIGEDTDIVHKEMYTFADRKGRSITLRPENTASVVRSYIEHRMDLQARVKRLFYIGPMFRYERPQKGRYRQFYQTGAEVFGSSSPLVDADTIEMVVRLLRELGLTGLRVDINSVGCKECRPDYRAALQGYLSGHREALCEDCRRRMETNPLRVLDCKVQGCRTVVADAPSIQDHLCGGCRSHQEQVFHFLDMLGVSYRLSTGLVRGLDYYTRTVFEVISEGLGAQNAILGGGRYDNLVKELGGPDVPAFGWALGMDRLMMVLGDRKLYDEEATFYVLPVGNELTYAVETAAALKNGGYHAVVLAEAVSLKSGLKQVNRAGGRFVLLAGESEKEKEILILRDMKNSTQREIFARNLQKEIKNEIAK